MPYALLSPLGLQPDAADRLLQIVGPRLPARLDRLSLAGVRVGRAVVDVSFLRSCDSNVAVSWTVRQGPLIVGSAPRALGEPAQAGALHVP